MFLFLQCRERGSSYTAQIQVSCRYTVNNSEVTGVVLKNIGEVPIMVKVDTFYSKYVTDFISLWH